MRSFWPGDFWDYGLGGYRGISGDIGGYGDNGQENGNYYLRLWVEGTAPQEQWLLFQHGLGDVAPKQIWVTVANRN